MSEATNGAARARVRPLDPFRANTERLLTDHGQAIAELRDEMRRGFADVSSSIVALTTTVGTMSASVEKLGDWPDRVARARWYWTAFKWCTCRCADAARWTFQSIRNVAVVVLPVLALTAYLWRWYATGAMPLISP